MYMFGVIRLVHDRHGNGAQTLGAHPGPILILTEKIQIDRDRGWVQIFSDSQSRIRGRG